MAQNFNEPLPIDEKQLWHFIIGVIIEIIRNIDIFMTISKFSPQTLVTKKLY